MEEYLGWSRGKAKAFDNVRSVDIDRHSITGERFLLSFFRHFLTKLSSILLFY